MGSAVSFGTDPSASICVYVCVYVSDSEALLEQIFFYRYMEITSVKVKALRNFGFPQPELNNINN